MEKVKNKIPPFFSVVLLGIVFLVQTQAGNMYSRENPPEENFNFYHTDCSKKSDHLYNWCNWSSLSSSGIPFLGAVCSHIGFTRKDFSEGNTTSNQSFRFVKTSSNFSKSTFCSGFANRSLAITRLCRVNLLPMRSQRFEKAVEEWFVKDHLVTVTKLCYSPHSSGNSLNCSLVANAGFRAVKPKNLFRKAPVTFKKPKDGDCINSAFLNQNENCFIDEGTFAFGFLNLALLQKQKIIIAELLSGRERVEQLLLNVAKDFFSFEVLCIKKLQPKIC
jgi:hypothetical protein